MIITGSIVGDVLLAQGEVVSQFNNRIVSALPTNRELLHSRAQRRLSVLIDPQQIATLAVTHLNSLVVAINLWRFPEICPAASAGAVEVRPLAPEYKRRVTG